MGLHRAGFDVVGVDIEEQPHYPFEFIRGDALEYLKLRALDAYTLVWASPPCQGRTAYKRRPNHVAPVATDEIITQVRQALKKPGHPHYVIENVPGAPLENPVTLCGSMFNATMEVRRHRVFEHSFPVRAPVCRHDLQQGVFPQATNRTNKRKTVEVGVWRIPLETQQRAMGIDWMTREELSQAIPPVYSMYLGLTVLGHISDTSPNP